MDWRYNQEQDCHEGWDGDLLLVVWRGDFGWQWLVYNQHWTVGNKLVGDSKVESFHDKRRKPHYTSKRKAQHSAARWVKGWKERRKICTRRKLRLLRRVTRRSPWLSCSLCN